MSELDRRELLKAVALTGVAASCVRTPSLKNTEPVSWANQLDPEAAKKVIDSFDARLSWIEEQTLPEEMISSKLVAAYPVKERAATESFIKQTMRSLYAVGRFMDLPDEIKAHPEMQSRMVALQSDMDHSISGMTNLLERLTPDDHKEIKAFLKKKPDFAEQVAAFIEEPAKEDGIPFQRRVGLRSNILQLAGRMAAQAPSLVTEPLVKKAHRLESMTIEEHDQLIAAKMGTEKFAAHVKKMSAIQQAWMMMQSSQPSSYPSSQPSPTVYTAPQQPPQQAPQAPPQQAPQAPPYAPPPLTPAPPNKGQALIGRGARILGLGAASTAVGALILSLSVGDAGLILGLVLGATLGPILLTVGLVVLIIGLAVKAQKV